VLALKSDQVGVRRGGVDVAENARGRPADKCFGKFVGRRAATANDQSAISAVVGGCACVSDHDMCECECARRGAWTWRAGVGGIDAVIERVELERRVTPESNRLNQRWLCARQRTEWGRRGGRW
jgi:hypothetical protein